MPGDAPLGRVTNSMPYCAKCGDGIARYPTDAGPVCPRCHGETKQDHELTDFTDGGGRSSYGGGVL